MYKKHCNQILFKMWTALVCLCTLLTLLYYVQGHASEPHNETSCAESAQTMTKVNVSQGVLEGEYLPLVTGDGFYYSFKGIPYAKPPLGPLRFKAPHPPEPWEGVRKATTHGAECTQENTNTTSIGSEDCLFLNVYSPNLTPESLLPVMVFIHGGGFLTGSGDDSTYGPDYIVNHGVILVTMNYRLGALGFLCLDTENVPGNAGLKDQVAALRWVRENIKNFGGDSDNVTIFGESSGGASVGYHILSPMSQGLFKRAVSMSGVPFADWAQPHLPAKRAFVLGKMLGKNTDDPKELLNFFQSLPDYKFVNVKPSLFASEEYTSNIFKLYHFTAVVEKDFGQERFLAESPLEMFKKGNVNDADVLIGHTDEESLIDTEDLINTYAEQYDRYPELLVPTKILIQSTPNVILEAGERILAHYFGKEPITKKTIKQFSRYITESGFLYDVHGFADRLAKVGKSKVYLYIFSSLSERNIYGKIGQKHGLYGAAHMDDLLYLFNPKDKDMIVEKSSKEYRLIQLVTTVFTNFAKYGNPTPDSSLGVTWPEYITSSKKYVDIGDQLTIGENYKADQIDFWKSIFENSGVEI